MDRKREKFFEDYFELLGSSYGFIKILENVIHHISWANDLIGFEFPEDYDEYEAKKIYLTEHENFQIEDSINIFINKYFIPCEIDNLIIPKSVFISHLVSVSFSVFQTDQHPTEEELKKAAELIEELKNRNAP